jgi:hypothetical protein
VRLAPLLVAPAALLALAGSAAAALPSGNIVVNGDAEAGPAATNQTDAPAPSGWQQITKFTSVAYGSSGFPTLADSTRIGGGSNFFAGGPDAGFGGGSAIIQDVDLSAAAPELDAGNVNVTLSGDLGGSGTEDDSAFVGVIFSDAAGQAQPVGLALQPVSPSDRGGVTGFVHRTACIRIPAGMRTAHVQITASRVVGTYNNGYADNVALTLSTAACPASVALPPPSTPQPGATSNAKPTSGRVLVKVPGSNKFQELTDARSIPIGSELDTEKGAIQLQTAANLTGKTQVGTFGGSKFVVQQKPTPSNMITDLLLAGGNINKCGRKAKGLSAAARRPGRRLFGNGHGRFRTRGRYASATVRGTQWVTKDSCSSTTVSVKQGTVTVRDLVKRKTIRLKAPKSYTARPGKR